MEDQLELPMERPKKRGRGRPKGRKDSVPRKKRSSSSHYVERNEEICNLFLTGLTLQQVGDTFGLTRERVRQILKKAGLTGEDGGRHLLIAERRAFIIALRDSIFIKKWGHTAAQHKLINSTAPLWSARNPIYAYRMQKNNNFRQGYAWLLTFQEWWDVWLASGKWSQRGRGHGKYGLSRIDTSLPFQAGNIMIQEFRKITKKARHRRSAVGTAPVKENEENPQSPQESVDRV